MEIEYKITSEDVLSIKQARPWVFADGAPLAARFAAFPDVHDGSTPFTLRLNFTGTVQTDEAALQGALVVTGGAVTAVTEVRASSRRSWQITVRPDGSSSVTVALAGGIACNLPGAICTARGVQLHNSPEVSVPGPRTMTPLWRRWRLRALISRPHSPRTRSRTPRRSIMTSQW